MHHSFFDRYSDRNSPIHRLDPRTKLLSLLLFVLAVVLTPADRPLQLAGFFLLLAAVIFLSGVPWGYIVKRSLAVLPFVLFISLSAFYFNRRPLLWLFGLLTKAWLAAMAMVVLSSATRFSDLLWALKSLGVPSLIILLFSFMYRYAYLFLDEAMRMERARQARSFRKTGRIRVFAHMLGVLFLRAYERGERIYASMLSRGFDGELRTVHRLRFSFADAVFAFLFSGAVIFIKVVHP